MLDILEKLKTLSLDERANLALNIQKSFKGNNDDFTPQQKKDLDIRVEEHLNNTDESIDFISFLSNLKAKYARI